MLKNVSRRAYRCLLVQRPHLRCSRHGDHESSKACPCRHQRCEQQAQSATHGHLGEAGSQPGPTQPAAPQRTVTAEAGSGGRKGWNYTNDTGSCYLD